ncbi:MAG: cytochrome c [Gemmatimonadota bacterium]|nr:cytochrome c [Gemmatimonadota bacterium]
MLAVPFALLTACGGDAPESAPRSTPTPAAPAAPAAPVASGDLVTQGQQVFNGAGLCFSCHGQGGVGTALGPNLTDDTWIWIENPGVDLQAKLVAQIRSGAPRPKEFPAPMPPMGGASLTEDQLQAVAAYVASL